MLPSRQLEHFSWWDSTNLHDVGQLVNLRLAWEYGIARVQLCYDAAKTPHVDTHRVRDTKDDLRSSVESRLDVGVDALVDEATRAEVDDLDAALVLLLQQDVFRLQVTVHYSVVFLELESL